MRGKNAGDIRSDVPPVRYMNFKDTSLLFKE